MRSTARIELPSTSAARTRSRSSAGRTFATWGLPSSKDGATKGHGAGDRFGFEGPWRATNSPGAYFVFGNKSSNDLPCFAGHITRRRTHIVLVVIGRIDARDVANHMIHTMSIGIIDFRRIHC